MKTKEIEKIKENVQELSNIFMNLGSYMKTSVMILLMILQKDKMTGLLLS